MRKVQVFGLSYFPLAEKSEVKCYSQNAVTYRRNYESLTSVRVKAEFLTFGMKNPRTNTSLQLSELPKTIRLRPVFFKLMHENKP